MNLKRTPRKITILLLIAIISLLVFSNFDLTKEIQIPADTGAVYFPVTVIFPVFFVFLYANIHYLKFSFQEGKSLLEKSIFAILNSGITVLLFIGGFYFWKFTEGDIDVAFFGETKHPFELNFRNIYFWVLYQTLLMAYGLSVLKILVSKGKKR